MEIFITGCNDCPASDSSDMCGGYICNLVHPSDSVLIQENVFTHLPITPEWCPLKTKDITLKFKQVEAKVDSHWDVKKNLIRLANNISKDRHSFQDYVLTAIDDFDSQSWDIFINVVNIDYIQMKKDREFWEQIYPHIKILETNNYISFRTILRASLITTFYEQELKLT